MHQCKKLLAFFLALALVFQMLPLSIFAEDTASVGRLGQEAVSKETNQTETKNETVQQSGIVVGEVTDLRGESEKHFRMDDGSFIAVDYGMPVHFTTDDGNSWQEIDNTLMLSQTGSEELQMMGTRDTASYVAKNGENATSFAANLRSGYLFSSKSGAYSVSMSLTDKASSGEVRSAEGNIAETDDAAAASAEAEASVEQEASETTEASVEQEASETTEASAEQETSETTEASVEKDATETTEASIEKEDAETAEASVEKEDTETTEASVEKEDAETAEASVEKEDIETAAKPAETEAACEAVDAEACVEQFDTNAAAEISNPGASEDSQSSASVRSQAVDAMKERFSFFGKNEEASSRSIAEQVEPKKLQSDVLYRNVYRDVDLRYQLYGYNVKETIVLNRPRESYSFSFYLDMQGLKPVQMEDGSVELRNESDEVIYLIPAPYMTDANGAYSEEAFYKLSESKSGAWQLTVVADEKWINDKERAFPVEIDPTIYFAGDSSNQQIFSGYINDNRPDTHPADSSSYIRCGNYQSSGATAGHAIGLIYVNKLPSVPANCVVTTSMLKLFQTNYSNGKTGYYNYPRLYTSKIIDSSFNSNAAESFINSLTWNNLTNKVYYGGGSSPETRTTIDYTKCMYDTIGYNHYFEITDTTLQWYEGTADISRLLVLDDGQRNMSINTRATFSGYGHGSFGHQPQLIVYYRNTIGVEGIYDYHTQNIGRAGTASVNNFTMGLSLSVPVYSAPSQALPFGLTLTYNSPLSNANFTASSSVHTKSYTTSATGYGWKTSVQQTVDRVLLTGSNGTDNSWLVYTDADGTEHYFKQKGQTSDYEDEDGLGLTITVNNTENPTTFTMKDKEKNTWTFLYGYLSSYVDNNGNALYYAYNGYDYSSSNSNWKPSNASTVYRVTSVWRKNSGVSSATKLVTLNYANNRLSSIVDMADRTTAFSYDTDNNLSAITYPDGKTATYTYSNASVTDPQTGASKTFHRLKKARDNEAQYEIRYTYWIEVAPRVKEIQEFSGAVGSEAVGTIMRGFKSGPTTTVFRYCGADNTLATDDDLIVRYYFDHWGRPVNVVSLGADAKTIIGIGVGAYKQNKGTNKDNNRMTHAASSGMQSVNLIYNSGIEHLTNNAGDLYGWTAQGNGAAAARTTSETSGTAEVKPRTGAYMMKLFLGSVESEKECCYQTVYLTAGQTYVFSGYVNTAAVSNTGTGGAYLSFRTKGGADINGASSRILNYKTNTEVDNGWERLEAVYTPTQSGTYQVAVNLSHMAKVVLADDLQLEKVMNTGGITGEASASTANLVQLGGFELPASSGSSTAEVSQFWQFSDAVTVENDSERGKVIRLANGPTRMVRAKQDVILNAPATRTYLVTAWGKMPVGYTSDGSDMKYNNMTYERFFGIIAKIYYVGYSTPEHQYIAFNSALGGWQYTSGMIVPKETSRTVERIELNITGDLLPNDTYVDDVTLIQEPVQTYAYDDNGNLIATNNTEGQTSTELDSQDRLKKYTAMNGVVYNLTYEGDSRQPKTIVSDGITTTYTYDNAGNVTNTKVQAPGNEIYLESSAAYDTAKNFQTSATDANGSTSYTSYNSEKGLLDNATNPNGVTTYYTYKANNDRAASTYLNGNDPVSLNYIYDGRGRLLQLNRKDYLGTAVTRQGYHFDYDAWGNVTKIYVGAAYGDTSNSLYSAIWLAEYEYNVNGTLAKMTYTNSDYVLYSYDLLDRLISEVYYNRNHVAVAEYHYVYNANGQLAKQYAKQNGVVTEEYCFEYDSLGRLIRSREGNDGATVQQTEHLYDAANRLTSQNWVVGGKAFSEEYSYNDIISNGVNGDGSLAQMILHWGTSNTTHKWNVSYDALNRVSSVAISEGYSEHYSRNYSYLPSANSSQTTNRLGAYTVKLTNNTLILGNQYEYDANGNITAIKEVTDPYRTIAAYTYDSLNQLKTETRYTYTGASVEPATTTVVTYTIDTAGNISSVATSENDDDDPTIVSYTYGDAYWSDRLSEIKIGDADSVKINYTYYDGGNCNPNTWYNGTSYSNLTWVQGRRLSSITKGSQTYSYEYDMSGVRSVKIANGLKHEYVTQNGKVVRDTVTNASTGAFQYILDFTYDESGSPFALRKYTNSSLTSYCTYYYGCNAQGDVVTLFTGNGNIYATYSYDAWGRVLAASGTMADVNPLRYRGYYYDTETGFYYLQSRYYDPIVKRFLNADSYGSTGQGFLGFNMFAYCGNNPVLHSDPSGHSWIPDISSMIEELVKEILNSAAERKHRFEDSFERTYGVPFSSRIASPHYSVDIETHYPDETAGLVSLATGGAGLALYAVPEGTLTKLTGAFLGATSFIAGLIDHYSSDTEYQMYVVDIWDVIEWYPTTDGNMLGIVCGEKHAFRIYYDASTGIETLGYLGAIDMVDHSQYAVVPGDPGPCYQYYCNIKEKGIYHIP